MEHGFNGYLREAHRDGADAVTGFATSSATGASPVLVIKSPYPHSLGDVVRPCLSCLDRASLVAVVMYVRLSRCLN